MYYPFACNITPNKLTTINHWDLFDRCTPYRLCSMPAVKMIDVDDIVWMIGMGRQNITNAINIPYNVLLTLRQVTNQFVFGFFKFIYPLKYIIIMQLRINPMSARLKLVSRACIFVQFGQINEVTQKKHDIICKIQDNFQLVMKVKIYGRVMMLTNYYFFLLLQDNFQYYQIQINFQLKRKIRQNYNLYISQANIQSIMHRKQEAYDNYGFKTTAISLIMEQYLADPEKQKQRIQVWEKILKSNKKGQQQQKILRQEVRKGIPDQLRPQVWSKLITPPLKQYQSIKVIEQLNQIDRDVNRTIPTNKRELELRQKLKSVLNIIAVAFPQMGYCQGLNFITANLLLVLNQKQTYNVMYHILYWQHHEKLMSDLGRIHTKLYVLKKLVKKHYPILAKFLDDMQIHPVLYASSWFITLFTNTLPCQYILRVLQMYFIQGQKILYRVGLQILKEKKRILKKLRSPEQVISQLKNYDQFNKALIDKFFKQMFQIKLSRKQIHTYQQQYQNTVNNNTKNKNKKI